MNRPFALAALLSLLAASSASAASGPALKDAFQDHFRIGAALNGSHFAATRPAREDLVAAQFNTITAENAMKWQPIHPRPGQYHFAAADRFVDFGERHGMFIVGHTLVWHSQTPSWVFTDAEGNPLDREALLERMRDHIHTVVGRYRGRVHGWDVVNEALNEDGSLRDSSWRRIIGDDYIEQAFRFAHEADPEAELYYNDYALENPAKRRGAVALLKNLQAAGVPVAAVGIQGHGSLTWPSPELVAETIEAFAELGLRVMITELDISVLPSRSRTVIADIGRREQGDDRLNPYTGGLPDAVQERLARRYSELFAVYLEHRDVVDRITFWGVTDGDSWLNNFPVRGRTNYPLLFDRAGEPKPAFHAVIETAERFSPPEETPRTFRNPILPGFHADPSLCRVGDDYYTVHSTFEYFPGVPILHSRDLVHWRQIGNVLDRESQLDVRNVPSSGGIFAPTIRHHDGVFYMICTVVWGGGNFYVTATDPAGPWSDPVWLDRTGIDPSLYFDEDGTVYYHRQVDGERGYTGQQVLNLETGKLEGEMVELWRGTGGIWPEGPHLYHVDGTWYLMISEGGTSYGHKVTVARSDSPWGPFESNPDNPILTHRHLPDHPFQALGHADMVETPDGWWMVFLGFRPQGGRYHHIGRETFLAPVTWSEDGWPVVNANEPIAEVMPAPRLPEHPWPEEPVRQEFDTSELPPWWQYVRNPVKENYSFAERPGWLRLTGAAETLADRASPTFLGRRQTALGCRVATRLSFDPAHENEEAGLALRGNERYHTQLGVRLVDGRRHAFLRFVQAGGEQEVLSPEPLPEGDVILSVIAEPLRYEFFYQPEGGDLQSLGSQPTRELSSEWMSRRAGMSFTGVYFGMYATGNGARSEAPADFAWFDYERTEL